MVWFGNMFAGLSNESTYTLRVEALKSQSYPAWLPIFFIQIQLVITMQPLQLRVPLRCTGPIQRSIYSIRNLINMTRFHETGEK